MVVILAPLLGAVLQPLSIYGAGHSLLSCSRLIVVLIASAAWPKRFLAWICGKWTMRTDCSIQYNAEVLVVATMNVGAAGAVCCMRNVHWANLSPYFCSCLHASSNLNIWTPLRCAVIQSHQPCFAQYPATCWPCRQSLPGLVYHVADIICNNNYL